VLTFAAPRTGTYADLSEAYLLQAVSAVALVGVIVLGSQLPRLLRWNRHPYRIGNTEVNE
jgi:membrane protein YdbS with pleckstrin-like domain